MEEPEPQNPSLRWVTPVLAISFVATTALNARELMAAIAGHMPNPAHTISSAVVVLAMAVGLIQQLWRTYGKRS